MGAAFYRAREARVDLIDRGAPIVFIVDDDVSVRESIEMLVAESGWRPEVFDSAEMFLARERPECPSCLILDVGLPDLNGIDVQRRIAANGRGMPVIFVTGCGDVRTTVEAMKAGAVEYLTKPFSPQTLREAIRGAVERSRRHMEESARQMEFDGRYRSLSRRERQVMELVVQGHLNKQVAGELGISEITVKAHRGKVMRKMCAKSLPGLVTIAVRLGLEAGQILPGGSPL